MQELEIVMEKPKMAMREQEMATEKTEMVMYKTEIEMEEDLQNQNDLHVMMVAAESAADSSQDDYGK